ncbi:hypothetical protein B0H14DRAFT_2555708 [Mycena olivaceomarginata]|nr:hypothetical protein B0H14DRAFT_2555708 [Mycena olivaceomarginata]
MIWVYEICGAKGKSSGAGKFRCERGMPSQPVTHGCVDLAGKRLTAAQNDEFEAYGKSSNLIVWSKYDTNKIRDDRDLYRTAGTWMVNMAAGGWSGTTADSVAGSHWMSVGSGVAGLGWGRQPRLGGCSVCSTVDEASLVMSRRCAWFHETVDLGWAARAGVVWVIDAKMNDSSSNPSNSMRLWDMLIYEEHGGNVMTLYPERWRVICLDAWNNSDCDPECGECIFASAGEYSPRNVTSRCPQLRNTIYILTKKPETKLEPGPEVREQSQKSEARNPKAYRDTHFEDASLRTRRAWGGEQPKDRKMCGDGESNG